MASRSQQKEEARARRIAAEQAKADRTRRQRRLQMLMTLAAGAAIAVAVAIVISSNKSSSNLKTGAQATQVKSQVTKLFSGIPQSGATLGSSSAPVTMTYYGDLECPICQQFTLTGGFQQLVASEVRSGKVKVVYRSFETATHDPHTFQTQQVAALAAGKQSHFWDFTELFYRQQGAEGTNYVTDSYLTGLARQIPGLNLSTWRANLNNPSLVGQVGTDISQGTAAGIQGTPTLIMEGPKGKAQLPEAVPSYAQLQSAVKAVS